MLLKGMERLDEIFQVGQKIVNLTLKIKIYNNKTDLLMSLSMYPMEMVSNVTP